MDEDNIKKRLSQLELDVKQMNQMIDENLHIDVEETEQRENNEDGLIYGDAHEAMEDAEDTVSEELQTSENKKDNHSETERKTEGYLEDEILQAIDDTQRSFVQNTEVSSTDNGEDNDNTNNDDEEEEEEEEEEETAPPEGKHNENVPQNEDKPQEPNSESSTENIQENSMVETTAEILPPRNEPDIITDSTIEERTDNVEDLNSGNNGDGIGHKGDTLETKPEEESQCHGSLDNTTSAEEQQAENRRLKENDEDEWEEVSEGEEIEVKQLKDKIENEEHTPKNEPIQTDEPVALPKKDSGKPSVQTLLKTFEDKIVLPKHNNTISSSPPTKEDVLSTKGKVSNNSIKSSNDNIVSSAITVESSNSTATRKSSTQRQGLSPTTPIERRKATNPFRVVSVGSPSTTRNSSRVSSTGSNTSHVSTTSMNREGNVDITTKLSENIAKLESRQEYLIEKCNKLEKEIKYLRKMDNQGTMTLEDGRKLNRAIDKLQDYLDRKTKERYEVGVLLSRQLRRQINRGENGEFWIGRK